MARAKDRNVSRKIFAWREVFPHSLPLLPFRLFGIAKPKNAAILSPTLGDAAASRSVRLACRERVHRVERISVD
jgi:hypothetical protein